MRRVITHATAALLTAGALLAGIAPAQADDDTTIGACDGCVDIDHETSGTEIEPGTESNPVINIPKPYKEYRYVANCSVNTIETGTDALCGAAVNSCPEDGDIRYQVYTLQHDADGSVAEGADWEYVGTQCRGPEDPPEGGPPTITIADVRESARENAPTPTVNVEPGTRTYVNLPTNFYTDDQAVDVTVTLVGTPITLTFTPTAYSWAYGDGGTGSGLGVRGADVGAPGAVEWAYRRSGTTNVTLTRTYAVDFAVAGGATGSLPEPGVTATSDPYPLDVGEIQSVVTRVR